MLTSAGRVREVPKSDRLEAHALAALPNEDRSRRVTHSCHISLRTRHSEVTWSQWFFERACAVDVVRTLDMITPLRLSRSRAAEVLHDRDDDAARTTARKSRDQCIPFSCNALDEEASGHQHCPRASATCELRERCNS